MRLNDAIIGSGICSLIYFKNSKNKLRVFYESCKKITSSENFYEYRTFGGNSNIWGGYINLERHKKFLKNTKYKRFFKKGLLKIVKIFESSSTNETYCLTDVYGNIFRVKKYLYGKNLIPKQIDKIELNRKNIQLVSNEKKYIVNNLTLCLGNLGLISLLFKSNLIKPMDKISFEDGSVSYGANIFPYNSKYYYIPMPIKNIIQKLIYKKSNKYDFCKKTLFSQKFSKNNVKYSFYCKDLLKMRKRNIRYFLSHHIVNLRVNNIPIRNYILKKSKKIRVFCTGTIKKYQAGPIIQDLIADILNN